MSCSTNSFHRPVKRDATARVVITAEHSARQRSSVQSHLREKGNAVTSIACNLLRESLPVVCESLGSTPYALYSTTARRLLLSSCTPTGGTPRAETHSRIVVALQTPPPSHGLGTCPECR